MIIFDLRAWRRVMCLAMVLFFTVNSTLSYAQAAALGADMPWMPQPGTMVSVSETYTPAHLKGMVIHPNDPFKFDFIIFRGDAELSPDQKQVEYPKLIKYFLASMAIPDADQWVNLSPYEQDRIIPDNFGLTEMGRDLLAQDYILKQLAASLTNPDGDLGKKFWGQVYQKSFEKFGTTDIPTDVISKVWIVPDKIVIYEKDNTVYVLEHHLKVMTEKDYLALSRHPEAQGAEGSPVQIENQENNAGGSSLPSGAQNDVSSSAQDISLQVMREVIIPAIEKEVNEGKDFAPVRQVYSGMVLAAWYKRALKESILTKVYGDQAKVKGIDQDPKTNQEIYDQYVAAFKLGVFNMIKEDMDQLTQEVIPRKYFSGGMVASAAVFSDPAVTQFRRDMPPAVAAREWPRDDFAMTSLQPSSGSSAIRAERAQGASNIPAMDAAPSEIPVVAFNIKESGSLSKGYIPFLKGKGISVKTSDEGIFGDFIRAVRSFLRDNPEKALDIYGKKEFLDALKDSGFYESDNFYSLANRYFVQGIKQDISEPVSRDDFIKELGPTASEQTASEIFSWLGGQTDQIEMTETGQLKLKEGKFPDMKAAKGMAWYSAGVEALVMKVLTGSFHPGELIVNVESRPVTISSNMSEDERDKAKDNNKAAKKARDGMDMVIKEILEQRFLKGAVILPEMAPSRGQNIKQALVGFSAKVIPGVSTNLLSQGLSYALFPLSVYALNQLTGLDLGALDIPILGPVKYATAEAWVATAAAPWTVEWLTTQYKDKLQSAYKRYFRELLYDYVSDLTPEVRRQNVQEFNQIFEMAGRYFKGQGGLSDLEQQALRDLRTHIGEGLRFKERYWRVGGNLSDAIKLAAAGKLKISVLDIIVLALKELADDNPDYLKKLEGQWTADDDRIFLEAMKHVQSIQNKAFIDAESKRLAWEKDGSRITTEKDLKKFTPEKRAILRNLVEKLNDVKSGPFTSSERREILINLFLGRYSRLKQIDRTFLDRISSEGYVLKLLDETEWMITTLKKIPVADVKKNYDLEAEDLRTMIEEIEKAKTDVKTKMSDRAVKASADKAMMVMEAEDLRQPMDLVTEIQSLGPDFFASRAMILRALRNAFDQQRDPSKFPAAKRAVQARAGSLLGAFKQAASELETLESADPNRASLAMLLQRVKTEYFAAERLSALDIDDPSYMTFANQLWSGNASLQVDLERYLSDAAMTSHYFGGDIKVETAGTVVKIIDDSPETELDRAIAAVGRALAVLHFEEPEPAFETPVLATIDGPEAVKETYVSNSGGVVLIVRHNHTETHPVPAQLWVGGRGLKSKLMSIAGVDWGRNITKVEFNENDTLLLIQQGNDLIVVNVVNGESYKIPLDPDKEVFGAWFFKNLRVPYVVQVAYKSETSRNLEFAHFNAFSNTELEEDDLHQYMYESLMNTADQNDGWVWIAEGDQRFNVRCQIKQDVLEIVDHGVEKTTAQKQLARFKLEHRDGKISTYDIFIIAEKVQRDMERRWESNALDPEGNYQDIFEPFVQGIVNDLAGKGKIGKKDIIVLDAAMTPAAQAFSNDLTQVVMHPERLVTAVEAKAFVAYAQETYLNMTVGGLRIGQFLEGLDRPEDFYQAVSRVLAQNLLFENPGIRPSDAGFQWSSRKFFQDRNSLDGSGPVQKVLDSAWRSYSLSLEPAMIDAAMTQDAGYALVAPRFVESVFLGDLRRDANQRLIMSDLVNYLYDKFFGDAANARQKSLEELQAMAPEKILQMLGANMAVVNGIMSAVSILTTVPTGDNESLTEALRKIAILDPADPDFISDADPRMVTVAMILHATWAGTPGYRGLDRLNAKLGSILGGLWQTLPGSETEKDTKLARGLAGYLAEKLAKASEEGYTPEEKQQLTERIESIVGTFASEEDRGRMRKALLTAMFIHRNADRKDGQPYFKHILDVVENKRLSGAADVMSYIKPAYHDVREDEPQVYESLKNYVRKNIEMKEAVLANLKRQGQEGTEGFRRLEAKLAEDKQRSAQLQLNARILSNEYDLTTDGEANLYKPFITQILAEIQADPEKWAELGIQANEEGAKKVFYYRHALKAPDEIWKPYAENAWYNTDYIRDAQWDKLSDILANTRDVIALSEDKQVAQLKKLRLALVEFVSPTVHLKAADKMIFANSLRERLKLFQGDLVFGEIAKIEEILQTFDALSDDAMTSTMPAATVSWDEGAVALLMRPSTSREKGITVQPMLKGQVPGVVIEGELMSGPLLYPDEELQFGHRSGRMNDVLMRWRNELFLTATVKVAVGPKKEIRTVHTLVHIPGAKGSDFVVTRTVKNKDGEPVINVTAEAGQTVIKDKEKASRVAVPEKDMIVSFDNGPGQSAEQRAKILEAAKLKDPGEEVVAVPGQDLRPQDRLHNHWVKVARNPEILVRYYTILKNFYEQRRIETRAQAIQALLYFTRYNNGAVQNADDLRGLLTAARSLASDMESAVSRDQYKASGQSGYFPEMQDIKDFAPVLKDAARVIDGSFLVFQKKVDLLGLISVSLDAAMANVEQDAPPFSPQGLIYEPRALLTQAREYLLPTLAWLKHAQNRTEQDGNAAWAEAYRAEFAGDPVRQGRQLSQIWVTRIVSEFKGTESKMALERGLQKMFRNVLSGNNRGQQAAFLMFLKAVTDQYQWLSQQSPNALFEPLDGLQNIHKALGLDAAMTPAKKTKGVAAKPETILIWADRRQQQVEVPTDVYERISGVLKDINDNWRDKDRIFEMLRSMSFKRSQGEMWDASYFAMMLRNSDLEQVFLFLAKNGIIIYAGDLKDPVGLKSVTLSDDTVSLIVRAAISSQVGGAGEPHYIFLDPKVDAAMNITPGGIDFAQSNLDMQIRRDGAGVPLPVSQQNLDGIKIDGLVPVILDIKPAASMPLFANLSGG